MLLLLHPFFFFFFGILVITKKKNGNVGTNSAWNQTLFCFRHFLTRVMRDLWTNTATAVSRSAAGKTSFFYLRTTGLIHHDSDFLPVEQIKKIDTPFFSRLIRLNKQPRNYLLINWTKWIHRNKLISSTENWFATNKKGFSFEYGKGPHKKVLFEF